MPEGVIPGEQVVEIRGDDLLQGNESRAPRDAPPAGPIRRDLDADEALAPPGGILDLDGEVEPLAADERKGMLDIHRQRGQDRQHHAGKGFSEMCLLHFVQVGIGQDRNPRRGERGLYLLVHEARESAHLLADLLAAGGQFFGRRPPIRGGLDRSLSDLLLQASDALHEELVVEHPHDAGELHALKHGKRRIAGELEHAAREGEPAQLAVQEDLGRVEGDEGRRRRAHECFLSSIGCGGRHVHSSIIFARRGAGVAGSRSLLSGRRCRWDRRVHGGGVRIARAAPLLLGHSTRRRFLKEPLACRCRIDFGAG